MKLQDNKVIGDMWVYLIENDRMAKVSFKRERLIRKDSDRRISAICRAMTVLSYYLIVTELFRTPVL